MSQTLLDAPDLREQAPLSLGDYLDSWLAHVRGRVRAKTYDGYECLIRLYVPAELRELALAAVSPLDLQRMYSALLARGLSAGTVVNLHLVMTQALSPAVRWGLISSNPAFGAQPPRPRRPERVAVDGVLAAEPMVEGIGIGDEGRIERIELGHGPRSG